MRNLMSFIAILTGQSKLADAHWSTEYSYQKISHLSQNGSCKKSNDFIICCSFFSTLDGQLEE